MMRIRGLIEINAIDLYIYTDEEHSLLLPQCPVYSSGM